MRRERELCNAKIRYDRTFNPGEEGNDEVEAEMTEEEVERIKVAEMWAESCYDQPRGKVYLHKKKCISVRTNQRVVMPSPLSAQEEAQLAVRT